MFKQSIESICYFMFKCLFILVTFKNVRERFIFSWLKNKSIQYRNGVMERTTRAPGRQCAHWHQCWRTPSINRRRGRVGKGVGHLAHVWSYGVREVVSSIPDRGNIVGWVIHPTRRLERFSLIWICLSFQILDLFRTLSSWGSGNYSPSAPLLYEVASHVKKQPFRPILLLYIIIRPTCCGGDLVSIESAFIVRWLSCTDSSSHDNNTCIRS